MARKDLIQHRRDTAANWTSVNPVLAASEMGFETDTGKFKLGDGTTAWTSLAYQNYTLPTSSTSVLGGVKVDGTSITINGSGIISGASTYTLPTASASVLGGVKVGTGLAIDGSGVLSASGGGGGVSLSAANIWTAQQTFTPSSTTTSAVVLQGLANQSANIQQTKNSAGTVLGGTTSTGKIYIGSAPLVSTLSSLLLISPQTPTYSAPNITITTSSAHNILPGDSIRLRSATPSGYNGTWIAQPGTTGTTLVIPVGSNPGAITNYPFLSYQPQVSIESTSVNPALIVRSNASTFLHSVFQDSNENTFLSITTSGVTTPFGINSSPSKDSNPTPIQSSVGIVAISITGSTYVPDKNSYYIVTFTTSSTFINGGAYTLTNNTGTVISNSVSLSAGGSFTTSSWSGYTGTAYAYLQGTSLSISRSVPNSTEYLSLTHLGASTRTLTVAGNLTINGTVTSTTSPITANRIYYPTAGAYGPGGSLNVVNSTLTESTYGNTGLKTPYNGSAELAKLSLSADKNISATTWTRVFGSTILQLSGTYMFNGAVQVVTQATNTAAKVLVKLYWQQSDQRETQYALASGEIYLPAISGQVGIGIIPISAFMDANINWYAAFIYTGVTMLSGNFSLEIYSTAAVTVKKFPLDDFSPFTANTSSGTIYNANGVSTYLNMWKIGSGI